MTDNLSSSLLVLAVFSGGITSDLALKGDIYSCGFFVLITAVLIFVREYFKVD